MLTLRIAEPLGSFPYEDSSSAPPRTTWVDAAGRVRVVRWSRGRELVIRVPGIALYSISPSARAAEARPETGVAEADTRDVFERFVLPLALQGMGYEVLHASAVAAGGRVFAFCADTGGGKSTLAAALVGRGRRLWADDTVVLEGGTMRAVAVPSRLRVDGPLRNEAAQFSVGEALPLAAVCVLDRRDEAGSDFELRELASAEALSAVLGHAWYFTLDDPRRVAAMVQRYSALIGSVSVYAIGLGCDFAQSARAVDAVDALVDSLGPDVARREGTRS